MISLRVPPLKVVVSMCLCSLKAVWLASSPVLLMDVFDRETNCLWHNPLLTLTVSLLIQRRSMSQSTQFTGSYSCCSLSSLFQLFWGAVMFLLFNGCVLRGVLVSGNWHWLVVWDSFLEWAGGRVLHSSVWFISEEADDIQCSKSVWSWSSCRLGSREFPWGDVRAGQIDLPFSGQFSDSSLHFRWQTPQSSCAEHLSCSVTIF